MRSASVFLVILFTSACAHRRAPAPTPPAPIPTLGVGRPQIEFHNLTHPTVSPFWGRAKADGEANPVVDFLSIARINWFPVVSENTANLTAASRVVKRTMCGTFGDSVYIAHARKKMAPAGFYVGYGHETREMDWNLMLLPDDPAFVDSVTLFASAKRVVPIRFDVRKLDAGKYPTTQYWWTDDSGRNRIEVEVTAPRSLLASDHNPFPCRDGSCVLRTQQQAQEISPPADRICAYGVWVQESLHGFRPEIHPAEALYWTDEDDTIHLLMLQDASGRFDGNRSNKWWTVLGPKGGPQMQVGGEHWVQEAMIGEFVVPIRAVGVPTVELIGQHGLEPIGSGGFPRSDLVPGTKQLGADSRIQAAIVERAGRRVLIIRAQIRGADASAPLYNNGAYAYLRIAGTGASF